MTLRGLLNLMKKKSQPASEEHPNVHKPAAVKFSISDGKKPTRDDDDPSSIFNLRAPMSLMLARGEERNVRLGVSCNYPLHVLQYAKKMHLIQLVDGVWAAQDRDQELVLRVRNVSDQDPLYIEEGETIARAAILCNAGLSVE